MSCDNFCSSTAEYRIHRVGQEPKNVCSAHRYIETHFMPAAVQPLTLEGHIADYKAKSCV